jgi:hypothetical protein
MYTVKPGDTLSGIAQNYNTTWQAIYDANQATLHNPNLVYAGEQLRVHEGDLTTGVVPAQAAVPQAATSSTSVQSTPVQSYTVTPVPASTTTQSKASTSPVPAQSTPQSASTTSAGYTSGSLSDIPGVPSSFAACVAYRESTNDTNPAANGNAYGIIPASGYNVGGDSIAQQKQVFEQIYNATGPSAWAADGC